ncbi:MAG: hypothetical protein IJ371_06310 [Clostridia bacterium]|nr:hypothetical protein [Clostridia bacterium]
MRYGNTVISLVAVSINFDASSIRTTYSNTILVDSVLNNITINNYKNVILEVLFVLHLPIVCY